MHDLHSHFLEEITWGGGGDEASGGLGPVRVLIPVVRGDLVALDTDEFEGASNEWVET